MNDLSMLSDEELLRLLQQQQAPKTGVAAMSDEELAKALGIGTAPAVDNRGAYDKLTGTGGPRYQTWPERMVRGIASSVASGATLPGDVLQGKASPNDTGRVLDLAMMGTPVNPAVRMGDYAIPAAREVVRPGEYNIAPAAGGMGGKSFEGVQAKSYQPILNTRPARPETPTVDQLKTAADQGYETARGSGVEFAPQSVINMGQGIQSGLEKEGIFAELAPKTFSILRKLQEPPSGSLASTFANIETARRSLGHAAGDFTNKTEQLAASRAINGLDDFITKAGPQDVVAGATAIPEMRTAVEGARGNYAAAKRSDLISGKIERAEDNAGAANSGQNIGNQLRQRMAEILKRPKEERGFTEEEIAQARGIVRGSPTTNAARRVGNFLGGGGGLGQLAATVAGTGTGGAIGTALGSPVLGAILGGAVPNAVGLSAKNLANALTKRQVNKLDEATRQRSPLYEQSWGTEPANPALQSALVRALMMRQTPDGMSYYSQD